MDKQTFKLENLPLPSNIKIYYTAIKQVREIIAAKKKNSDAPSDLKIKCTRQWKTDTPTLGAAPGSIVLSKEIANKLLGFAADQQNENSLKKFALSWIFAIIGSTVGANLGGWLLPDTGTICGALVGGPIGVRCGSQIAKAWSQKKNQVEEQKNIETPVSIKPKVNDQWWGRVSLELRLHLKLKFLKSYVTELRSLTTTKNQQPNRQERSASKDKGGKVMWRMTQCMNEKVVWESIL